MDISAKSKSRISKQISKIYGIDSKSMVMPQTLRNDLRRFPLLREPGGSPNLAPTKMLILTTKTTKKNPAEAGLFK
jgi:hypothetical protein